MEANRTRFIFPRAENKVAFYVSAAFISTAARPLPERTGTLAHATALPAARWRHKPIIANANRSVADFRGLKSPKV